MIFNAIDSTDADSLAQLTAAAKEMYQTGGDATHVAYSDLGETLVMFPGDSNPKSRFVLVWKSPDIPKFIEAARKLAADEDDDLPFGEGGDADEIWLDNAEADDDDPAFTERSDGSVYVETTVSIF